MRVVMSIAMFTIGCLYHYNGMNDWFALQAVTEGVTIAQAANEIIASICFSAGIILLCLPKEK